MKRVSVLRAAALMKRRRWDRQLVTLSYETPARLVKTMAVGLIGNIDHFILRTVFTANIKLRARDI